MTRSDKNHSISSLSLINLRFPDSDCDVKLHSSHSLLSLHLHHSCFGTNSGELLFNSIHFIINIYYSYLPVLMFFATNISHSVSFIQNHFINYSTIGSPLLGRVHFTLQSTASLVYFCQNHQSLVLAELC